MTDRTSSSAYVGVAKAINRASLHMDVMGQQFDLAPVDKGLGLADGHKPFAHRLRDILTVARRAAPSASKLARVSVLGEGMAGYFGVRGGSSRGCCHRRPSPWQ
ncbi:MAG: hypothetical protein JHC60_11030 [Sphingobium sp.]|nr:hypothetical protein [Sphingobium sp.]